MINLKVVYGTVLLISLVNANIFTPRRGSPPPVPPKPDAATPEWGYITQKVDNFNSSDTRTWTMRYKYNNQFHIPGGPLFIFIGSEGTLNDLWLTTGQMYDMAAEHNGSLLSPEHRFYGESMPLGDYTTKSLKYLNSQQALADLAHFIKTMKNTVPGSENSKIVVVGCSYSASLATWSRLKYPELIDVAYASSGPIIAIDDFYQYEEVVGDNIAENSADCYKTLEDAMEEMEKLFDTEEGIKELGKTLNTCKPIRTDPSYKEYLFYSIAIVWNNMVQYAQPGRIILECYMLAAKQGTPLEKLAAYVAEKNNNRCMPDYSDMLFAVNNTVADSGGIRQFVFQTCQEFGFFQTTSSSKQPFRQIPVDYYHRLCKDAFGDEFTPEVIRKNIDHTNEVYGGLNKDLSYVISVHGSVDPWHPLGITESLNDLAPGYLVYGYSHCGDLYSISSSDFPEMIQTKQSVKDKIAEWIKQ